MTEKMKDTEAPTVSGSSQERLVMLPMPDGMTRMESGPIQFGDDWPGVFLRGDNAIGTGIVLNGLADNFEKLGLDPISLAQLRGTADLLFECKAT